MHFFMVTRATAKAVGFPYFCEGKPCNFGNICHRRVHTSQCYCSECANARRIRESELRAANIERYRGYGLKYDRANKELRQEKRKERDSKIEGGAAKRQRELYWQNPDRHRAYPLKYRALHPERNKAYRKITAERHPEKLLERARKRTNAQLQRTPGWYGEFDSFVVEECYLLARARKKATGCAWHVDHMYPLRAKAVSGLHCGLNLQVIPGHINSLKRNYRILDEPDDWLCALI